MGDRVVSVEQFIYSHHSHAHFDTVFGNICLVVHVLIVVFAVVVVTIVAAVLPLLFVLVVVA